MNKEQVQKTVEKIKKMNHDPERAHSLEDELRDDFIKFVARRDDDLGAMAKLVLSTNDIAFARWYA